MGLLPPVLARTIRSIAAPEDARLHVSVGGLSRNHLAATRGTARSRMRSATNAVQPVWCMEGVAVDSIHDVILSMQGLNRFEILCRNGCYELRHNLEGRGIA